MPVVDTTRTFTNNEQITSTKLNEIMDNSSFVSGAVVTSGGLEVTGGGQMQVATSGITTTKIADANITQAKLASNVAGNGPAFIARASTSTSVLNNVDTKINLVTEVFDTNNNYNTANSRFTPTVAGYYQILASVHAGPTLEFLEAKIYKNGSVYSGGSTINGQVYVSNSSILVYLNGSGDYIELYGRQVSGSTGTVIANTESTYMCGFLARSA